MEAQGSRGIGGSTVAWVLAAAGCAGVAFGCSDARRVVEAISREQPAPLSLPAEGRPGEGPDGRVKGPAEEPEHAAEPAGPEDLEKAAEGEAEAQPGRRRVVASTRGRRRRPAPVDGAAAERAGGEGAAEAPGEVGEAVEARAALKVTRLVMAREIAGREPVGVATSFGAGENERLFAFVELTNEAREASEIVVALTPPDGGAPVRIKLDVGAGPRWRTWAMTRKARAPGAWSVAVSGGGGAVLARTSFQITK